MGFEEKNILVTGGAGFIGTHTVVVLLKEGFRVSIIDNFDNSCHEAVNRVRELVGPELSRKLDFNLGDLRNKDDIENLFSENKFDAVIHFAGLKAVGESVAYPFRYFDNNLIGSINLYQTMAKYNCKKLVFSSSATVYGQPEKIPCVEDFKLQAMNPYGRTKLFLEEIARDIATADSEWSMILLRYFNPVAAHESGRLGEDPKGIPNNLMPYIQQVAVGRLPELNVYGHDYPTKDGTAIRDYIHVMDLAEGHVAAMRKLFKTENIGCTAYNLGTGRGVSVLEMVAAFERASGKKIPLKMCPRRPGDAIAVYASTEKATPIHLPVPCHCVTLPSTSMAENPNSYPSISDNLLEFDRFVSQTSNPNPNYTSIEEPSTTFSDPISTLNFNPHPTSFDLLTVTIPRKRRRGRPRSTTSSIPSRLQVLSIPQFSRNSSNANASVTSSSSSQILNPSLGYSSNNNNNISSSSTSKAFDISDEIIVINKEATAEALTALTAGFPADSLTDEEIDAGVVKVVGGIEQVNYILIRNHIITKWRENVSSWVTKEMFLDVVPEHCHSLLDNAYDYLLSQGYVNFGVAPSIKDKIPAEPCKPSVIIIGAGMAGLGAARQLLRFGFKVTVLEGRKRAGGRVYTKKMEGANRIAAADLGGSVLTGTLGNPLGILARQLSYSLHKIRDKCPIYNVDGSPVDPNLDSKVEIAFNKLLERSSTLRQLMGDVSMDLSLGAAMDTFADVNGGSVTDAEMRLFNWHLANLEYANAGLLSKLSLAFWDQDDPYDMGGDHCFLSGGNGRLIHALAENVPILYEKTVNTIRYGSDGVQVTAGNQVFEGDMVLCTVPLGVLKNGSIRFIPELPQKKLDGIKRMGFGLLNKVAMLFPHVFWGTDLDTFGHLCENSSNRGEFFLFYSYATVAGGPLLIALVAGEAAHKFESMPPTDAVSHVLQILRGIYEPQGISVPEPIQTVCTRWGSDPFCLGSYSNVAVGASGDDYDILAESVGDGRLFFAGEATTRRYPATMHGAFLTGLREAANMTRYASARALKIRVQRNPSKNAHTCASLLADLFREPDLEFGNFSIIFNKNNADPKSTAILRVTFSEPRRQNQEGSEVQHSNKLLFQQLQAHFNQQQQIHVYTLLTKEQALELREVRGGDDMRLNFLGEKLGVKLVGRKGLGTAGDLAIASIKAERGVNKPRLSSLALKSGILKRKVATGKQRIIRRAKILRNGGELAHPKVVGNGNNLLPSHVSESASSSSSSIPSQVLKIEKPSIHHSEAPLGSVPTLLRSSQVQIEKNPATPAVLDQRNNSLLASPNESVQQKPNS